MAANNQDLEQRRADKQQRLRVFIDRRITEPQCERAQDQQPDPGDDTFYSVLRVRRVRLPRIPPREIEKCENKNPDHVDKMPVEARVFNLVCRNLPHRRFDRQRLTENGHAALSKRVEKPVEARDDEESLRRTTAHPRIVR